MSKTNYTESMSNYYSLYCNIKKQFLLIHLNDGFTYCTSQHHPREVLQSLPFWVHNSSRGWIYLSSLMSHGAHRESASRQWDGSETCFILYMANTDELHLPPGRDVKRSCIVKCEHCHTNLTEITVVCNAYPVYQYQWDICSVWLFKPLPCLWGDVLQVVLMVIW